MVWNTVIILGPCRIKCGHNCLLVTLFFFWSFLMHLRKSVQFILAVFLWEKFDSILVWFFFVLSFFAFFFCLFLSITFLLNRLRFSDGELSLNFLPVLFCSWALLRSCITLTFMMFVWHQKASVAREMGVCCLVMCQPPEGLIVTGY